MIIDFSRKKQGKTRLIYRFWFSMILWNIFSMLGFFYWFFCLTGWSFSSIFTLTLSLSRTEVGSRREPCIQEEKMLWSTHMRKNNPHNSWILLTIRAFLLIKTTGFTWYPIFLYWCHIESVSREYRAPMDLWLLLQVYQVSLSGSASLY